MAFVLVKGFFGADVPNRGCPDAAPAGLTYSLMTLSLHDTQV